MLDAKDPDVPTTYAIDFHDEVVREALPRTDYALGLILFFAQDTGFYYEVTTAGKTGVSHPRNLPRSSGQTVRYGSCVLTCRHPADAVIPTISSAVWTLPSGITQDSSQVNGLVASITLSGGTDGVDYDITCRMTPSSGNAIDKTITVPVRAL